MRVTRESRRPVLSEVEGKRATNSFSARRTAIAALAAAGCLGLLAALPAPSAADEPPASEKQEGKPDFDWVPAIHLTKRDAPREIKYIIVHTIEGTARGCISWFRNPKSKVSAHYVIDFDGKITQMVRDQDVAWHAGTREHNAHGIGIEHEGYAKKDGWTPEQMRATAALSAWLCKRYDIPIDRDHLLGHNEIAPKRKSDPGPHFDWDEYIRLIKSGGKKRRLVGGSAEREPEKTDAERADELLERAKARREAGAFADAEDALRRAVRLLDGTKREKVARERLKKLLADPTAAAAIAEAQDAEEARNWLGLAEGYLANGFPRRACEILERLLAIHEGREREAKRARALLETARNTPSSDAELDEQHDAPGG